MLVYSTGNIIDHSERTYEKWIMRNQDEWHLCALNTSPVSIESPDIARSWTNAQGTLHAHRLKDGAFIGAITLQRGQWWTHNQLFDRFSDAEQHLLDIHTQPDLDWTEVRVFKENLILHIPGAGPEWSAMFILRAHGYNHWMIGYELYKNSNIRPLAVAAMLGDHTRINIGITRRAQAYACQSRKQSKSTSVDYIKIIHKMLDQTWPNTSAHARLIGLEQRALIPIKIEQANDLINRLPTSREIVQQHLKSDQA